MCIRDRRKHRSQRQGEEVGQVGEPGEEYADPLEQDRGEKLCQVKSGGEQRHYGGGGGLSAALYLAQLDVYKRQPQGR